MLENNNPLERIKKIFPQIKNVAIREIGIAGITCMMLKVLLVGIINDEGDFIQKYVERDSDKIITMIDHLMVTGHPTVILLAGEEVHILSKKEEEPTNPFAGFSLN